MANIEKMVATILNKPHMCAHTSISNDLASAVYARNCPELLIPLLESQNDEILRTSIWIASELGQKSYPLLPFTNKLLTHHDAYIRYYALDCILASTQCIYTNTNGLYESIIKKIYACLSDPDENVREKATAIIEKFSSCSVAKADTV